MTGFVCRTITFALRILQLLCLQPSSLILELAETQSFDSWISCLWIHGVIQCWDLTLTHVTLRPEVPSRVHSQPIEEGKQVTVTTD